MMNSRVKNGNCWRRMGSAFAAAFALAVFAMWQLVPARAQQPAYGQRIVSPEREDTAQHPDWLIGPAVKDLQDAMKGMIGAEYTVAHGDKEYAGAGIFLVLTTSPAAPADAVTKLKGKGREPFIIRSVDEKNLWIIANKEDGLSHGVYFYLEQLGCHWFLPNDHWTVIPKRESVAVKMDRLVAPAFKSRGFFGTGGFGPTFPIDPKYDRDGRLQFRIRTEDWKRRNRFGGEFVLAGHAGESFNLENKAELAKHPEYLASVGGKREWSITAKLDPTNPAAVKLWSDWCLKNFRAARKASPDSPYTFAVSVDPADGGGFCDSAECRKVFQAHGENDATFYSNQVFFMANEVAKAVRKEFPDGYVSLYGYADHSAPPSFPLEPNVYVMIIPYGFNYSGLAPNDFIAAWGKKTSRISIYDYWSIPDWASDYPNFNYLEVPKQKLGYWNANNVEGFASESTYGAGAMGIAWFLSSRIMWDPKANQDAILASFYNKCFGPAAPPMKRMLERWTRDFMLSSNEMGMTYEDLSEAEKLAGGDAAIVARIDDFAKYAHYLRLNLEYNNESDPEKKSAINLKRIEHLFDIYDTNMVHSFRMYQFYVDYGRTADAFAEFDNTKPDAPGWARVAPLTHDEVAALIEDGSKTYKPLGFQPKTYTGKLVPLKPVTKVAVPAGDAKWGARMSSRGGMNVDIAVPASLKSVPLRIMQYYDNTITLVDETGKAVFVKKITGVKDITKFAEFEVPIPAAGRYTIQFRPISGGGFSFQTLPGLTLSFSAFLAEMGAPSPRLYFYVPAGLKTVAVWLPHGDWNNNGPNFRNPDNEIVKPDRHDAGKLMLLTIPEGQAGKIWSMDYVRSPDLNMRLLNAPNSFSLYEDTLMVPADALK